MGVSTGVVAAKRIMERAKEFWEELGFPELKPRMPWYGYSLGAWTQRMKQKPRPPCAAITSLRVRRQRITASNLSRLLKKFKGCKIKEDSLLSYEW